MNKEHSILQYNPNQVQNAMNALGKYLSLVQNNNRLFEDGNDLTLTGEYNNVSLKRSNLKDSTIQEVDFMNTALAASYFSVVNIFDTTFNEANLQHCQFIQTEWKNVKILSTNMSYSNFYDSKFTNTTIKGSSVTEVLFQECIFENCVFTASGMENTVFLNCTFKDVKFMNCNVEYMELKGCQYKNIFLPMSQIPYIFGFFQDTKSIENDIKLSTDFQIISLEEYGKLKESLIIYYDSIQEFFPLANIYLASCDFESAYYYISSGIKKAIIQRNFRMLKFFCKLAKQGNLLSYGKLKELYALIERYVSELDLNIYEQRSFIYNIGEIRSTLLDSMDNFPTVRITMQTNIDSSESQKILQFLEYIDTTISEICTQKISHIEFRHNSDANFVAFISAHYTEIILALNIFLTFSNNIVNGIQEKILNQQKIKLNQLEIEEKKIKLQNAERRGEVLQNSDIEYTVQYIIDNPESDGNDTDMYL